MTIGNANDFGRLYHAGRQAFLIIRITGLSHGRDLHSSTLDSRVTITKLVKQIGRDINGLVEKRLVADRLPCGAIPQFQQLLVCFFALHLDISPKLMHSPA